MVLFVFPPEVCSLNNHCGGFFFKKKSFYCYCYIIYIYIFWSSKIVNTFAFQSFQDGKSSGDVLCAFSMCYFHQLENSKGTFGYIIYCTSIYA